VWWIFYGQQKGTNSMNAERIAELRDWINRHAWTDESGPFVSDLLAILDQAEALPELVEAARDLWLKTAVIPVDWKNLEAKELSANAVKSMDAVHAALAKIEAALDKPAPPAITSVEQFGKILFFDCISKPSSAPERNCEQCDHAVECDESCKRIEAFLLSRPAPPDDDPEMKDYYDFSKGRRGPVVVDRPDKMIAKPAPPAETQCPACEGSGREPIGEHFVTADMASDGGQPERAGESMGIEYGPCPECGGTGQQRQATEDFAISPEEGKKIMMSVKKFYNAKPVPPYQTTDGTLTFKMPQATTAPPTKKKPYVDEGQFYDTPEQEEARDKSAPPTPGESSSIEGYPDSVKQALVPPQPAKVTREQVKSLIVDYLGLGGMGGVGEIEMAIKWLRDLGIAVREATREAMPNGIAEEEGKCE